MIWRALRKSMQATWRAMRVPAIIYADEALICDTDDKVYDQAVSVATLPGRQRAGQQETDRSCRRRHRRMFSQPWPMMASTRRDCCLASDPWIEHQSAAETACPRQFGRDHVRLSDYSDHRRTAPASI